MARHLTTAVAAAAALSLSTLGAQERIDTEINAKIRAEGMDRSQILRTMHHLTDVYGPRLTGSPNHKAAAEWAVKQMTGWGFENGHLEPWDFGHPGWLNERLSAHIVSPVRDHLVAEALAWTNGTNGPVTAEVFHLVPPEGPPAPQRGGGRGGRGGGGPARLGPTQEELTAYLEGIRSTVRGRIVLVGRHTFVPVTIEKSPLRRDDAQVKASLDPSNPQRGPQRGPQRQGPPPEQAAPEGPRRLNANAVNEQVEAFLIANGAIIRVNDGGRDHGQIRAFNNRTFDPKKALPTVILRNEDFGRIARIVADGTPVRLEIDVVNRWFPEGATSYNAVAEIPGTDKRDEVVMLGGHLDSWHAATGATDNAIGCAVMMEAARILKAIGVKPRRTIRVALWGGEEQGLLGSKAYVKEHFGTFENPKPEFHRFNGYFNVDSGTGRIRSASVFGPATAADVLRAAFAPFEDLGIMGAGAASSRRSGGTDSTSFNEAGLPGIGLGQDPIEYQTYTWHTNLDTYERIVEEDVKKSAVAIAAAVYHVAMREEMLPRFTKEEMPAPPAPQRPPTGGDR
jgi:hypothetical protein